MDYRGYKVVTASAPANAWNGLLRLGIMSRFDLAAMGHNSAAYLHHFAEATKLAYRARIKYAGDPDVNPPPLGRLLSENYWMEETAKINRERATPFELVFWRSLFAFLFVAVVLVALGKNPLKMG